MKILLAALAIAAAVATPAFAQAYDPEFGTGNIVPNPVHGGYGQPAYHGGYGAYARGYDTRRPARHYDYGRNYHPHRNSW